MSKKLNIHEVRKHSRLKRDLEIFNSVKLVVRPWGLGIIQKVIPLIAKVAKEVDSLGIIGKVDQMPIIQLVFISLPIIERNQELFEEVIDIIYDSLENSNAFVLFDGEEYEFFTKEDFVKYVEFPDIKEILAKMYEVNFTANPSLAVELKAEIKREMVKEDVSMKAFMEEANPQMETKPDFLEEAKMEKTEN
jgi:hypothetical protein